MKNRPISPVLTSASSPVFGSILPVFSDFTDEDASIDYWLRKHRDYVGPPRTKIFCTIGKSSSSADMLGRLFEAGMNVAVCDFSRESRAFHEDAIKKIRAMEKKTRKLCAVLLATRGPAIQTGALKDGLDSVRLKRGQEYVLHTDEKTMGDDTQISVKYSEFPKLVKVGSTILMDNGAATLIVKQVSDRRVTCQVQSDCHFGSQKTLNVPGTVLKEIPSVTQRDVADIKFGVQMGVDFIAASFVRSASDIRTIREILANSGRHIQIIAKIQNEEGLRNFDEILDCADGIIISRSDLGLDIPMERVPLATKLMIRKCNGAGKPVVTATQMLQSMCLNPTPTRAEASDVGNAIFDGSDGVMLTGETSSGLYPEESVKMMALICRESEQSINYQATFQSIHERATSLPGPNSIAESLSSSAVKTAFDLEASVLIVFTFSGRTARLVSKYRPSAPILMLTESIAVARQGLVSRGLIPLLVGSMSGSTTLFNRAISVAKSLRICEKGDVAVLVSGGKGDSVFQQLEQDDSNVIRVIRLVY